MSQTTQQIRKTHYLDDWGAFERAINELTVPELPEKLRPFQPPPIEQLNPTLGRYELVRSIATNELKELWLVKDRSNGDFRVAKFTWYDPKQNRLCFERESAALELYKPLSELSSHLTKISDSGFVVPGSCMYYLMEAADDVVHLQAIVPASYTPRTLNQVIQQNCAAAQHPPASLCLEWMLGVTKGLVELHAHSLIHCDIKPSNIIFVNGVPKIADIGLLTSTKLSKTEDLIGCGTSGFCVDNEPKTHLSDIYGFGKTFFELITGLDRKSFPSLPREYFNRPDSTSWRKLNKIVLKCADMSAKGRFQTSGDLLDDLYSIR